MGDINMNRDLIFKNQEHITFFEKNTKDKEFNCYEFSLIYLLGLAEVTRIHFNEIYSKELGAKYESISAEWQTEESIRLTILAFNLYEDYLFGFSELTYQNKLAHDFNHEQKNWESFIKINSISNLFSDEKHREFYLQAISLRLD